MWYPSFNCRLQFRKRRDLFCEENLPLEDIPYRWLILDSPEESDLGRTRKKIREPEKSQWELGKEALDVGQSFACASTTEPSLGDKSQLNQAKAKTLITQKNPRFITDSVVS